MGRRRWGFGVLAHHQQRWSERYERLAGLEELHRLARRMYTYNTQKAPLPGPRNSRGWERGLLVWRGRSVTRRPRRGRQAKRRAWRCALCGDGIQPGELRQSACGIGARRGARGIRGKSSPVQTMVSLLHGCVDAGRRNEGPARGGERGGPGATCALWCRRVMLWSSASQSGWEGA